MPRWTTLLGRALVSAAAASTLSALALALLSRRAGKGSMQPLNATSHWLNGEAAAARTSVDLRHTGTGYATHFAATLFWALLFEAWLALPGRRQGTSAAILWRAVAMAPIAAAADYGATPKRFTPGWEFVLSKPSMAAAYLAMSLGLALPACRASVSAHARRGAGRAVVGAGR